MKVHLINGGCVEGQLSSTYLERFLAANNKTLTNNVSEADLVLFYSCGLTNKRERETIAAISNVKMKMKPMAKLIVWGCLDKINPDALKEIYDGPMIGALDTSFFETLVGCEAGEFDSMNVAGAEDKLIPCAVAGSQRADPLTDRLLFFGQNWDRVLERVNKNTPYVIRVAKGCNGACAYCSERPVFGRVRSREAVNILSDFEDGLKEGYRLFSLMATDLGAYGRDIGLSLTDLLIKITDTYKKEEYKIILNQVNPFHLIKLQPDLEGVFETGRIYSLSSPVQSGSDRILRLMNRPHTAGEWRNQMLHIHKKYPRIKLVTQFMVGFPTETEEDLVATERLLDFPCWLDYVHVFKFSPRPTVPAARFSGQVPEYVKEMRRIRLLRRYAITKILGIPINGLRKIR